MNPHFGLRRDYAPLPSTVYARVDSVEIDGDDRVVLSFSAVGCDSVNRALSDLSVAELPELWASCWRDRSVARRLKETFDKLELLFLTVTVRRDDLGSWNDLVEQSPWLLLKLGGAQGAIPAMAYMALFALGQQTSVELAAVPSPIIQQQLNAAFSMAAWPTTPLNELSDIFATAHAESWHAFDVGQGSANGFVGDAPVTMFHDLGCGVYANAHTAPWATVACHSEPAPIVLSHWDTDHWAGARRFAPSTQPECFLKRVWIAPLDATIGVTHIVFALDILAAGGDLKIIASAAGPSPWMSINGGREMRLIKGSGNNRNDAGLALEVKDCTGRHWLVTGDVGYDHLKPHLKERYVAIAAPHHGAACTATAAIPKPEPRYARLVYSFGGNNSYGHPAASCINAHIATQWDHGNWSGNSCAVAAAPKHIRSTGCNPPGTAHLGGIIIGWTCPPTPRSAPPCPGLCTAYPAQA